MFSFVIIYVNYIVTVMISYSYYIWNIRKMVIIKIKAYFVT